MLTDKQTDNIPPLHNVQTQRFSQSKHRRSAHIDSPSFPSSKLHPAEELDDDALSDGGEEQMTQEEESASSVSSSYT